MSRLNKILSLLLVIQLMLIAYVYRPNRTSAPPSVNFFKGIDAAQVVGLTISDGQKSLTMSKDRTWHLETNPPYPADTKKIEALTNKLTTLTSSRLVAHTSASHGRLRVTEDDYSRKITLSLADGTGKQLLLGTSPNYKTIHVRAADDVNVYLVKDLADWEASATPDDWWDNNYIDVDPNKLTKLTLKNSHGALELTRDKEHNWQAPGIPPGKELAYEALHAFLNKACLIQLSSYLNEKPNDAKLGLNKPMAELLLTTDDGVISLKIAPGDKEKEEFTAKTDTSPFYVAVHDYEIRGLLDTSLSTLLVEKNAASSSK